MSALSFPANRCGSFVDFFDTLKSHDISLVHLVRIDHTLCLVDCITYETYTYAHTILPYVTSTAS